jgi:hypothetical protein
MLDATQKIQTLRLYANTGRTHKTRCGTCCRTTIRNKLEGLHFYNEIKQPNGFQKMQEIFLKIDCEEELTLFDQGFLKMLASEYNREVKANFFTVLQTEHNIMYVERVHYPTSCCAKLLKFFKLPSEPSPGSSLSSLAGCEEDDNTSTYTTF